MHSNYDDVVRQMQEFGLELKEPELGRMRRVNMLDDRNRKRTGWYILHELTTSTGQVLLVGAYGDWREGADRSGKPVSHRIELKEKMTAEESAAIKASIKADREHAERRRLGAQKRAADKATSVWRRCSQDGESDYLKLKKVQGYGVRYSSQGNLVIPMMDSSGRIFGLQVIYDDPQIKKKKKRDKDFWPAGLAKRGHYHMIGLPHDIVLVAEGYATAATLHESTGWPVVVAFDAGNLLPVCLEIKRRYKHVRVLVCADDDYLATCQACGKKTEIEEDICSHCGEPHGKRNAGVNSASAAALAVGGDWVAPRFSGRDGRKQTDYNDLHVEDGLHVVDLQIRDKIEALGWDQSVAVRATTRGGGGDNDILKPIDSEQELLERFTLIYGHRQTAYDAQERILLGLSDVRDACTSREIHRRWMESIFQKMVRIDEVGFDPAEQDKNILRNLWGGWPTIPKSGCCDRLLELLEYLCAAEQNANDIFKWILKWLAYPIQNPGAKMRTALVLHGPQGVGKNLFFESVMAIYGEYGRIVDQSAVEDRFNDWASAKLFLIADEVEARQELFHVKNKLKAFITSDWIHINPKNVNAYQERNHLNIVFLSNETQPLILDRDDRRYCVIWTPPKLDMSIYTEVKAEIDEGGIQALHDYLLNLDLGDFNEYGLPPMTRSKAELIEVSQDMTQRFWAEWTSGGIDPVPVVPCRSRDLYGLYREWCIGTGYLRYAPEPKLLAEIGKRTDGRKKISRYLNGSAIKQATFIYPPGAEVPPDQSEQAWLSKCMDEFHVGVNDWKTDKRWKNDI